MHTAIKKQRETAALESLAATGRASEERLDRIEAALDKLVVEIRAGATGDAAPDLAPAIDKIAVRLERIESTLRQMNQPPPTKGGR